MVMLKWEGLSVWLPRRIVRDMLIGGAVLLVDLDRSLEGEMGGCQKPLVLVVAGGPLRIISGLYFKRVAIYQCEDEEGASARIRRAPVWVEDRSGVGKRPSRGCSRLQMRDETSHLISSRNGLHSPTLHSVH